MVADAPTPYACPIDTSATAMIDELTGFSTEPNEVAAEAYPGGIVVPLSSFDPSGIPDPEGKQVVFACRSGKRSVTASLAAQNAGLPYDRHLAGGMLGWKAAGLPTKTGG